MSNFSMVVIETLTEKWNFSTKAKYSAAAYDKTVLALGYDNGLLDIVTTLPPKPSEIITIDTKCDRIFFLEIISTMNSSVIIGADQNNVFAVRNNEVGIH